MEMFVEPVTPLPGLRLISALNQVIDNSGEGADVMSTVSIMGDFSFATKAFLHGDNDCGAAADDPNLVTDGDDRDGHSGDWTS